MSYAQSPEWEWATSPQGKSGSQGSKIIADAAGNIYVSGITVDTLSFGGVVITANDGTNFIVKYDANRNAIWAKNMGSSKIKIADMTTDNSGNLYQVGHVSDMFITKFDADGNVLWARSSVGVGDEVAFAVTADNGGNTYITGYFNGSEVYFGKFRLYNFNDITVKQFIVKYDPDGNAIWARSGGENIGIYCRNICIDNAGNLLVTGHIRKAFFRGLDSLPYYGGFDVFLSKYDTYGSMLWATSAGGSSDDEAENVCCDSSGNIYITGEFRSPAMIFKDTTLYNTDKSSVDMFIAKYSADGNLLWAKSAGRNGYDKGMGIAIDSRSNIYVSGLFSDTITFDNITLTNPHVAGTYDAFIVKCDSNGKNLWAESFGGNSIDHSSSITIDASENLYVTGVSRSQIATFGSITLNLSENYQNNIFIAKLKSSTTAITEDSKHAAIHLFPNPAKSTFHISGIEGNNWSITIYSLTGEKIYESFLKDSQHTIDLSGKAKGTYIYQLQKEGEVFKTGKIIIE
jgi:hypothetical protein